MGRDAFEVIDTELPAIRTAFAAELAARLAAGERLTSSRNGVAIVEYLDAAGKLVVEPLAGLPISMTLAAAE